MPRDLILIQINKLVEGGTTRKALMPDAPFCRAQAETYRKLAESMKDDDCLGEEMRQLARRYFEEARRIERGKKDG